MKASERIKQFIRQEENAKLIGKPASYLVNAYRDGSRWAIGYGANFDIDGSLFKQDSQADMVYVEDLLDHHVNIAEAAVNKYITVPLNQNQYDACVSLTYNIGTGNFQKSFAPIINQNPNDFVAIEKRFLSWVNPNNRRNREIAIYKEAYQDNSMLWIIGLVILAAIGLTQRKRIAAYFKSYANNEKV